MRRILPLGLTLLIGACTETPMTEPDAGPPATGVFLAANGSAERSNINGIAPRTGFKYYLVEITMEARGVGPISIAPFTFHVILEDSTRIRADARTNELGDGCSSRMIPVDGSTTCRLAFEAPMEAPPPVTLQYDNDGVRVTASVPPPM